MKWFLCSLVIIFCKFAMINTQNRMMNATEAKVGQFPFMVALTYESGFATCSGSLISVRHVLTAAHCFKKNSDLPSRYVIAGDILPQRSANNKPPRNRQVLRIMYNRIHPLCYVGGKFNASYDVAVAILNGSFVLSRDVAVIPIAKFDLKYGDRCTGMGFGVSEIKDSRCLRYAFFVVEKNCDPNTRYYCAAEKDVSTWGGDSGGPLVSKSPPYEVYGVCSARARYWQNGMYHYRTIYPSALRHRNWITGQMNTKSVRSLQTGLSKLGVVAAVPLSTIALSAFQFPHCGVTHSI